MHHLQVLSSHRSQCLSFRPRSIGIRFGCFIKIKCIITCKSGHDEMNSEWYLENNTIMFMQT